MGTNDNYLYEPLSFSGTLCRIATDGVRERVEVWGGTERGWVRSDLVVMDVWTRGERMSGADLDTMGVPAWAR